MCSFWRYTKLKLYNCSRSRKMYPENVTGKCWFLWLLTKISGFCASTTPPSGIESNCMRVARTVGEKWVILASSSGRSKTGNVVIVEAVFYMKNPHIYIIHCFFFVCLFLRGGGRRESQMKNDRKQGSLKKKRFQCDFRRREWYNIYLIIYVYTTGMNYKRNESKSSVDSNSYI